MDAEIAVGGFEHALEVVEAERLVGGESADDAEANALVNEAIKFGEFGGAGGRVRAGFVTMRGFGFGGFAVKRFGVVHHKFSFAPAGLDQCFLATPRLTPWAVFFRRSAAGTFGTQYGVVVRCFRGIIPE